MMIHLSLLCVLAMPAAPAAPAAQKLIVAPISGGSGTTVGMVRTLDESFAAEIRRHGRYQVLTHGELKKLLSHEELKALLGCTNDSCFAAIGDVAGAAALATGTVGKIGTSWVVALKLIDVAKAQVIATADRRIKNGSADDLLDQMPPMVAELFEKSTKNNKVVKVDAPPPVPGSSVGDTPPVAFAIKPYTGEARVGGMTWFGDGKGLLVGLNPEKPYDDPVFAGRADDPKQMFLQRVRGGGRSGEGNWSLTFWDPRARARWQAGIAARKGEVRLQCGDHEVPLKKVDSSKLVGATLHAVRWQRHAVHIARDDRGTYFLVDQALEPEANTDYRLFVGRKGKVKYLPVEDAIIDPNSSIFISDQGRFIIRREGREAKAAWAIGDTERELAMLDIFSQAAMVYTSIGAYTGQSLGTPCDSYLQ